MADTNEIVLASGRRLYAYAGVLGLNPEKPGTLFYGYDGIVEYGDETEGKCTDEERREIAERMVVAWKKWGRI